MIATGRNVSLAEGLIDDTCLFIAIADAINHCFWQTRALFFAHLEDCKYYEVPDWGSI